MTILRLLLTWMLLAAVPVQGFAAASMLFCLAATHDVIGQATYVAAPGEHERSAHSHEGSLEAKKVQPSGQAADTAHSCGLCATCCHSVAIMELSYSASMVAVPLAQLTEPVLVIANRSLPFPDKPPRG